MKREASRTGGWVSLATLVRSRGGVVGARKFFLARPVESSPGSVRRSPEWSGLGGTVRVDHGPFRCPCCAGQSMTSSMRITLPPPLRVRRTAVCRASVA